MSPALLGLLLAPAVTFVVDRLKAKFKQLDKASNAVKQATAVAVAVVAAAGVQFGVDPSVLQTVASGDLVSAVGAIFTPEIVQAAVTAAVSAVALKQGRQLSDR